MVRLVEREWKVERHHESLVARAAQLGNEGVVAEAAAAIHPAGAGGDLDDVQDIYFAAAESGFTVSSRRSITFSTEMPSASAR